METIENSHLCDKEQRVVTAFFLLNVVGGCFLARLAVFCDSIVSFQESAASSSSAANGDDGASDDGDDGDEVVPIASARNEPDEPAVDFKQIWMSRSFLRLLLCSCVLGKFIFRIISGVLEKNSLSPSCTSILHTDSDSDAPPHCDSSDVDL